MLKLKTLHAALPSLFAVMLSACASGPDYKAPQLPIEASAGFITHSNELDREQAPPSDWWRLYQDDALDIIIQLVLEANTEIRSAEANLARARAIYDEVGGDRYPATEIGAGARYGRDQASWLGPGKAPSQWTYTGGLAVAYEVDLFGQVRRGLEAAQADTERMAAVRDAVRLAVVAESTRAYVDVCTLGKSIEVAQNSVSIADSSLQLITQREAAGSATNLDVERAAASVSRAEAALSPLLAQRRNRLLELAALMGKTPAEVPESAAQCRNVPNLTGIVPIGNGEQMLRRRPDVRIAERQLAADTARIGVAVADLYPRISLGADASYLRNDSLRGDRTWSFGIGPLISWHFPNQIIGRAQIKQAEAQTAASLANFDGIVINALKEAEQALTEYSTTLQQHSALKVSRDHSRNAFILAQQRYQSGAIDYLDVLVAQLALIDAESELISVEQRLGSQRVSVFLTLGGGWEQDSNATN